MISLLGMIFLLGMAWLCSADRRAINPRTDGGAFAIQVSIAALVLYTPFGQRALEVIAEGAFHVISYSQAGMDFLFLDGGQPWFCL